MGQEFKVKILAHTSLITDVCTSSSQFRENWITWYCYLSIIVHLFHKQFYLTYFFPSKSLNITELIKLLLEQINDY